MEALAALPVIEDKAEADMDATQVPEDAENNGNFVKTNINLLYIFFFQLVLQITLIVHGHS